MIGVRDELPTTYVDLFLPGGGAIQPPCSCLACIVVEAEGRDVTGEDWAESGRLQFNTHFCDLQNLKSVFCQSEVRWPMAIYENIINLDLNLSNVNGCLRVRNGLHGSRSDSRHRIRTWRINRIQLLIIYYKVLSFIAMMCKLVAKICFLIRHQMLSKENIFYREFLYEPRN